MVTTRSKDKAKPPPGEKGEAAAGSKRGIPHDTGTAPPPKHQKKTEKKAEKKNKEPDLDVKKKESQQKPTGAESEQKLTPGSETATVLEKGLIYFFSRPRVSIDDPKSVHDIARSFFILRPAEADKTPRDDGQSRLCIIPKKVLPTSGRERWIGFVEKGNVPYANAAGDDVAGKEYTTRTIGKRHVPDAIAVGEGVYALTKLGRAANLVYMLTEPKELGEIQRDLGLKDRGYFTISTKNPTYPPPKGMGVSEKPKYTQEIMDDFQSLRWIPTQPRHLDYDNTQFLLIGHRSGIEEAFKPDAKGAGHTVKEEDIIIKEEPLEGEEDLMYEIKEDEVLDVLLDLEKYAHDLKNIETEF